MGTLRGMGLAAVLAAALAGVPAAAQTTAEKVATLAAEAKALKVRGERPAALAKAEAAVALAERDPGRNDEILFAAVDALTSHIPDQDFERQYAVFDRLVPIAARAKGGGSFEALQAAGGRALLAFVLRKPGATIAAVDDILTRALPLAVTDDDRAQMAGWAMVLAQLYDSTGAHDRAVAIVAKVAPFYDTPPAVPNEVFGNSLMSLAQRYASWQDWPRAISAAERGIAASVAYYGRRTFGIETALRVRGQAHVAYGRYAEAERDYREAIALSDAEGNHLTRAGAMLNLARFYVLTGRGAMAVPMLERVAEDARSFPAQSNTRMVTLLELYNIALHDDDGPAALRHALAARDDAVRRGLNAGPNYVTILLGIANASMLNKRFDDAARTLDEVAALLPKSVQPNSPRHADLASARGKLADSRGDTAASVLGYRDALARWDRTPSGDPLQQVELRAMLAAGLLRTGERAEAWRTARLSGDGLGKVALMRVGAGNSQPIDSASLSVFDTAIDAAWAYRRAR